MQNLISIITKLMTDFHVRLHLNMGGQKGEKQEENPSIEPSAITCFTCWFAPQVKSVREWLSNYH